MALLSTEYEWQFDVNRSATGASFSLRAQAILFNVKQALVGFASNPWTIVGSSNGTTSGMDAVDRWSSASAIVYGTTTRAWIVFEQAATGVQVLFDWSGPSSESNASVLMSVESGFSGGSTSSRPTASDEVDIDGGTSWLSGSGGGTSRVHVLHSEDGTQTRVVVENPAGTSIVSAWVFSKVKDAPAGWTTPYVGLVCGELHAFALWVFGARGLSKTLAVQVITEFVKSVDSVPEVLAADDDFSGQYVVCPVGFFSDTAGARGLLGRLPDTWWASIGLAQGTGMPGGGSKEYMVFSEGLLLPWNGTELGA